MKKMFSYTADDVSRALARSSVESARELSKVMSDTSYMEGYGGLVPARVWGQGCMRREGRGVGSFPSTYKSGCSGIRSYFLVGCAHSPPLSVSTAGRPFPPLFLGKGSGTA